MPELPETTFDDTNMVLGRHSIIVFTPAGGGGAKEFLVDYLAHLGTLDVGSAQGIGTGGVAFTAKSWARASDDVFRFRSREIKKLITAFGSLAFFARGTCELFIRDPEDATGKVALLSEAFACSIYRDPAEAEMSPANPAECTIVVQSLTDDPVELTPDATVT